MLHWHKICFTNKTMKQIVAIPILNKRVAPCFEASEQFQIIEIADGKVIKDRTIVCSGSDGFRRLRLLKIHDVDVLVCGGVKNFFLQLLLTSKIKVFHNVSGRTCDAVSDFLEGRLNLVKKCDLDKLAILDIPHSELVDWAKELFEQNGYEVTGASGEDHFLVDMVAKINCPVCNKPVSVAICCGAHSYRPDQEICEFHNLAKSKYNAQVFVYPEDNNVAYYCNEFEIDMLSPDSKEIGTARNDRRILPLIGRKIEGHDDESHRTESK